MLERRQAYMKAIPTPARRMTVQGLGRHVSGSIGLNRVECHDLQCLFAGGTPSTWYQWRRSSGQSH